MNRSSSITLAAVAALAAVACVAAAPAPTVVRLGKSYRVSHHSNSGPQDDDPVGGDIWPVAIFWMYVEVGTPAVQYPVAIDSGSATLDFPYVNCPTCIHRSPNVGYNDSASSTSKPYPCDGSCACVRSGQCGFSNSYQTCDLSNPSAVCTITGLLWEDQVSIHPATGAVPVQFGTITSQTSNFDQFKNIDGVVGLAGPPSNSNVFASLYKAGKVAQDVFAMCFLEGKVSNGTMTVGGLDKRLYNGTIQYTPNAGGFEGFYGFQMASGGIAVGGSTISGTGGSTFILDSGTNVLLLSQRYFSPFKTLMQASCGGSNPLPGVCGDDGFFGGKCLPLTDADIARFPDITLSLSGGVELVMHPQQYLLLGEKATGYCLGVRNTGFGGNNIVGDTTMENYYVVFDRTNAQIGFAPVNRDNCGSI